MAELGTWEDPASVIPGGEFVDAHVQRRTPVTARALNSMIVGVRGVRTTMSVLISEVNQIAADLGATMDDYVPRSRSVSAGTGLSGGGDLTADRSLTVEYGATATTAARGDDARIVGSLQKPAGLAPGDLLVGAAANAVSRLAKAADGYVLKLVDGLPSWQPEGAGGVAWTEATLNAALFAWYVTETDALRLAYSKVGDRVYLQGEFRAIASVPQGSTLCTLPVGMRPSKVVPIVGWIATSANPNTSQISRTVSSFTVHPDGAVKSPNASSGNLGSLNTSFPLR